MIIRNYSEYEAWINAARIYGRAVDVNHLVGDLCRDVVERNPEGFTYCPKSRQVWRVGACADPEEYVVGIKDYGAVFERTPTHEVLLRWVTERRDVLQRVGSTIGGCLHQGLFEMDISVVVLGLNLATEIGGENSQRSIFHLHTGKEIGLLPVPHSGTKSMTMGAESSPGLPTLTIGGH